MYACISSVFKLRTAEPQKKDYSSFVLIPHLYSATHSHSQLVKSGSLVSGLKPQTTKPFYPSSLNVTDEWLCS